MVNQGIAVVAAVVAAGYMLLQAARPGDGRGAWIFPAVVAVLFVALSLYAGATEGVFGFWTEHIRNFWGNQIWIDLLAGVGVGWYFLVPELRALGIRPLPWAVLVALTGSIGFLTLTARVLYLRERRGLGASLR